MSFNDRIDPTDHSWTRLSQAPSLDEMPGVLLCPSKHRASRCIIEVVDDEGRGARMPVYGCAACGVAYRYQECTLPPGEEGHPPAEEASA